MEVVHLNKKSNQVKIQNDTCIFLLLGSILINLSKYLEIHAYKSKSTIIITHNCLKIIFYNNFIYLSFGSMHI